MARGMKCPPFIIRIAGVSADLTEPFASSACMDRICECVNLEEELTSLKTEMVEELYSAIQDIPPIRGFLLSVKRDCFNGRSLARHRNAEEWQQVGQKVVSLLERILDLEERLATWRFEFAKTFSLERKREHAHLLTILADPKLRRGIALASPALLRSLERLQRSESPLSGRKERKLEESLLRYVSRAAFKLSPFSTLTRVGLGQLEEDLLTAAPELIGSEWRESSLARLKRYRMHQLITLILRHPAFRAGLCVKINDTVEEIGHGQYSFLRLGWYGLDAEGKRFRHFSESLVKASLSGPMISWLLLELPSWKPTFEELVSALQDVFQSAERERIEDVLVKLLDLGFLQILPPWPCNEPHIERCILAALHRFEREPILRELLGIFERLVTLATGYPSAESPLQVIEQIDRELAVAWDVARSLAALSPEVKPDGAKVGNFNEDVFLSPADLSESPAIFRLPATTAYKLQQSLEPIARFSHLFDHRHDFRHALETTLSRCWPGCLEVPFTEALKVVQTLLREYADFSASHGQGALESAFDPLHLEEITRLEDLRRSLWTHAATCVHSDAGETHISLKAMKALASRIPMRYAPGVGPCLFVQPMDAEGNLWVLNRMLDGTGRYGSRYTAAMDMEVREGYTDHFNQRSTFTRDGNPMEFLDLMWPHSDNLNVHAVQTPRVLELPGERSAEVPTEHRVRLSDMRIRLGSPEYPPYLVDRLGRHLLPVYLGTMSLRLMSPTLKFLAVLGPSDFSLVTPPRGSRTVEGIEIHDRLIIGPLVLLRRRWIVPTERIAQEIEGLSDAEAFVRLNRWRSRNGVPDRVFIAEKTPLEFMGQEIRKPQYLDFTSPLFQTILRSVVRTEDQELRFEEMLPLPTAYPKDAVGRSWAVEAQLDTLAFAPRALDPLFAREESSY